MANKVCVVLALALAMFGTGSLAKPGYASPYDVDYYVSVFFKASVNFRLKIG